MSSPNSVTTEESAHRLDQVVTSRLGVLEWYFYPQIRDQAKIAKVSNGKQLKSREQSVGFVLLDFGFGVALLFES